MDAFERWFYRRTKKITGLRWFDKIIRMRWFSDESWENNISVLSEEEPGWLELFLSIPEWWIYYWRAICSNQIIWGVKMHNICGLKIRWEQQRMKSTSNKSLKLMIHLKNPPISLSNLLFFEFWMKWEGILLTRHAKMYIVSADFWIFPGSRKLNWKYK